MPVTYLYLLRVYFHWFTGLSTSVGISQSDFGRSIYHFTAWASKFFKGSVIVYRLRGGGG